MKNFYAKLSTRPIGLLTAALILLIASSACDSSPSPTPTPLPTSSRKINLGKQQGAITLLAGSNNDLNIAPSGGTTTIVRLTPNASGSTVSGMLSAQFVDGDLIMLRNDGTAANVTVTNNDTNSAAANRFLLPSASSMILPPKGGVWVEWDGTSSAWLATPGLSVGDTIVSGVGHLRGTGTAPTLSTCGTSPAIAGSDVAGVVTTGSAATTCTITFAATYTTAPACFFLPTGTATMPVYTVSATAITVATDIASTVYSYGCVGH